MNSIHHAELIRCSSVRSHIPECVTSVSEVSEIMIEKFGIDDAKELIRLAYNRPVNSDELTLLVRTEFITHEAQNALLKVLEEPPYSTRFVFIVPNDINLLATLKSRFNEESTVGIEEDSEYREIFNEFSSYSYKDRLSLIEKAVKHKDTAWQRSIKQGLTNYLNESKKKDKSLVVYEYVARTLMTRGASNKMLLEHLALTL